MEKKINYPSYDGFSHPIKHRSENLKCYHSLQFLVDNNPNSDIYIGFKPIIRDGLIGYEPKVTCTNTALKEAADNIINRQYSNIYMKLPYLSS